MAQDPGLPDHVVLPTHEDAAETSILFVDDEASLRSAFVRTVSPHGFRVDVAGSVLEAVRLAALTEYPVIATDLAMPGDDGIDLIRRLHQQNPGTVFVIVTGREDIVVPTEPEFRDSVISIVSKPWDVNQLVETLRRSVQIWQSRIAPSSSTFAADGVLRTLLLIEDCAADAALVEAYLEGSSYQNRITHRRSLAEGVQELEKQQFGVIISDLALPDARGLDAVLRIQRVAGDTPLVVMSGVSDDTIAEQAVQAGAQDVLVKGAVEPAVLLRAIRHARQRKQLECRLTRLAYFDPLTGLANRSHFNQRLDYTLARSRRTGDGFAVMFVDLDNFKTVNDELGHAVGDAVIAQSGVRLKQAARAYDTVARLGGDEFAIILDGITGESVVRSISDRVIKSLSRPHIHDGDDYFVTASIGIALYPIAGNNAGELLRAADQAMYAAKRRGRNTYRIAPSSHRLSLSEPIDDVPELNLALQRREFELHYQPQYDQRLGRQVAAEALLRWHRNGLGLVFPAEFLPQLEESNAIVAVGAWVIEQACNDLRNWHEQGLPVSRVSVNVSVRQLEGERLVETLRQSLADSAIAPACLELEITESLVMSDPEQALRVLNQIKQLGVRIAMDDFGAGHSSLSYLYRLPINTVKLDRSFVRDLPTNDQCQAVTAGIIALARQLGLEVVAEGVETEAQRMILKEAGCELYQGYLFGRPKPSGQFVDELCHLCQVAGQVQEGDGPHSIFLSG